MNKKVLYFALGVAIMGTTSCSKKLGDFQSNYFNTTPTPLETVGQNVPATITGNIPAKFMVKNAKVTATPVLEYSGGATQGTPVVLQGENVRANGQVVSYNNGGTVQIPFNTEYKPEMAESNLYLDFQVDQNGKLYSLPRVKVGDGVIATSTLANASTVQAAIAKDNFERIINEKYTADIRFLINQAIIRNNQITAADYVDLNQQLRDANAAINKEIAGVTIHSYASPDGTLAFNTELAERREKVTEQFMANQLKKDKITEFGELTATFTPEDWEGFQELVSKSNIQDKDLILGVLKMYKDPEQREREIRNLSGVFNELADQILPQLRYSKIMASINVIGKSDQELIEVFNTNPGSLSEDEILYVATLTEDYNRKKEIYAKAGEVYPNSARAMNNLGMAEYELGNYAAAKSAFEKAKRLDPSLKSTDMNLGLLELLNGNYSKANELLGSAAGVPEAADALGVYYLTQGEVAKANTAFGNSKTNNAALAKLLSKDYSAAQSILSAVPNPDATTYYMAALVSARTNNENGVLSNLRKAISMDSSMLQKAQNDLEFAQFNLNSL
ncbi:MAG: tetratricopeptide repeat protein [Muribaculaceae bacterium]|nr:tetratricopeptide repeat protein [Muribaculaceae bacterium]MDE6795048.1 tetratricopeptide repeat protein [Muribaculaceae bacterium]